MAEDNEKRFMHVAVAVALLDAALGVAAALALTFLPQFAAPLWARVITWIGALITLACALMAAIAMRIAGGGDALARGARIPERVASRGAGRNALRMAVGVVGLIVLTCTPLLPQWRWAAVWMALLIASGVTGMTTALIAPRADDSDDEGGEQ